MKAATPEEAKKEVSILVWAWSFYKKYRFASDDERFRSAIEEVGRFNFDKKNVPDKLRDFSQRITWAIMDSLDAVWETNMINKPEFHEANAAEIKTEQEIFVMCYNAFLRFYYVSKDEDFDSLLELANNISLKFNHHVMADRLMLAIVDELNYRKTGVHNWLG